MQITIDVKSKKTRVIIEKRAVVEIDEAGARTFCSALASLLSAENVDISFQFASLLGSFIESNNIKNAKNLIENSEQVGV